MSEALSSFLISVSIIVGIALFVPCLELTVRRLRRKPRSQDVWDESQWDREDRGQDERPKSNGVKKYSRETA